MKKFKIVLMSVLLALSALCVFAACGKKNKAVLTFVPNGGTMEQTTYEVDLGTSFDLPEPTREGYAFDGWFTSKDLSGTASPMTIVAEENTKFYAAWSQAYLLTFDLGGGTMSASSVYVKPGANIAEAVKEYIPEKANAQFGEWLMDGAALAANAVMPEAAVTLTAHYKTACTVLTFYENLSADGYTQGESVTEYAYAGAKYTPVFAPEGFVRAANADAVLEKEISEDASQNEFKVYFDRRDYTVTFLPSYPAELEQGESRYQQYPYGTEIKAPYTLGTAGDSAMFEAAGYCFVGWATEANGEVVYHTDYINDRLYQAGESVADTILIDGDLQLFAVWQKGYLDVFRGDNYIFVFDGEPSVAYLQRDTVFFKGEYRETNKKFYFSVGDEIVLEGSVLSDGLFAFSNSERGETACTLYRVGANGGEFDESVTLHLDEYNGVRYEKKQDDGPASVSDGTYTVDENGLFVTTFTTGELAGQTLNILCADWISATEGTRQIFMVRNEEEYAIGQISHLIVSGSAIGSYPAPYDTLTFDGFGSCQYVSTSNTTSTYYYVENGDNYDILNADGSVYMTIRIDDEFGGYFVFNEEFSGAFPITTTERLELDGFAHGRYVKDGETVEGYVSFSEGAFGTMITLITTAGNVYVFRAEPVEFPGTGLVIDYDVTVLTQNYGEFYFSDDERIYLTTLLVLDSEGAGKATLYGMDNGNALVPVAKGTYAEDMAAGTFTFTAEEYTGIEATTSPYDFTTIKSFTFDVNVRSTQRGQFAIFYCFDMTPTEGEKTVFSKEYAGANGTTLTLAGGFATYKDAEGSLTGPYVNVEDNVIAVTISSTNLLFEIDGEKNSFVWLTGLYGTLEGISDNGVDVEGDTLTFDGKGNATYTDAPATGANGQPAGEEKTYAGTYTAKGTSESGLQVFTFTAEGLSFDFVRVTSSSSASFIRFSETYNGTFAQKDGSGTLILDGYGYEASYLSESGVTYTGQYVISGDALQIVVEEGVINIDLLENKQFSVRGGEYGTYVLVNNQEVKNLFFSFDGYGNVSVTTTHQDSEGHNQVDIIDAEGTYELSRGVFTIHYVDNGVAITVVGGNGTVQIPTVSGRIPCVLVEHMETARTYVNEKDLSVLVLNGYGTAVRHNADGTSETGSYVLLTEHFFYYTNGNVEDFDGCIYRYDVEKGVATPSAFVDRGYYTKDLEAMQFSRDGSMSLNGTAYYYSLENDVITLYRRSESAIGGVEPNLYGFVPMEFGGFTDTKEYEGKTYYRTSGFSIQFERTAGNADKYPVPMTTSTGEQTKGMVANLSFAPSGNGTFTVSGSVQVNNRSFSCVVHREVAEDGTASMWFVVQNFRFDFTVTYNGDADENAVNSYEITGMRLEVGMSSELYVTLALLYQVYIGILLEDTYGTLTLVREFNEAGEATSEYVNGAFLEDSRMYDAAGKIVTFEKAEYTLDTETNIYTVDLGTRDDGYAYRLRFYRITTYGYSAYRIVAFTRVQTLEAEGGYKLEVERIITSDVTNGGRPYELKLYKDDAEIEADPNDMWLKGNQFFFILRTQDEEKTKNVAATYYIVTMKEKIQTEIGEDDEDIPGYPPYESFTVEQKEAKTYQGSDGAFVDICEADHTILMLYISDDVLYIPDADATTYDEATATYTMTTAGGTQYKVKIADGAATIERVEATATPDEQA